MRLLVPSILLLLASTSLAADLPRSAPEAQGVDSAGVLAFVEAVPADTLHSVMLVRHGQVVAEAWWTPYDAQSRHMLFSLSKSFTATAVGIAQAEGKLSVDDEVLKFFPEDAPADPSANLKAMRVSDLLRMNTGHQGEPPRKDHWVKTFLAHPVPFKPGTHFLYNTSATYMQSAVVQKATGENLLDYLRPRLFEPLGIENPTWEMSPQGVATGGFGLSVRTEDIAKFGQLYLQKGKWNGKQLVPESYIAAATARQTSNGSNPKSDWDQGYGYQFWRCRHGAYRGDGAFGQYCVVMPEQDAVLAMTGGLRDMQQILNIAWDKLLPAMKSESLPKNDEASSKLAAKLKGLSLTPVESSGTPAKTAGKKFVFAANDRKLESLSIESKDEGDTIVAKFDGVEQRVACSRGKWNKGKFAFASYLEQPAAATGGWQGDTFTAKLCFIETPYVLTLTLKFDGHEVTLGGEQNVNFGPTKWPPLVSGPEGQAANPAKPLSISIVPGDWDAPADNIEAVCRSAAEEIARHVPGRTFDPISIRQDVARGPMVIYGLDGGGRRRVLLNVKGTFWAQFSYQFAHEFCHVLCNYRDGDKSNHWFEESLCEMASLYAMRRMAETWKTKPPYSNWKSFAPSLASYAQDRIDATEKLDNLPLAQWYRRHEPELRKTSTDRARNQVIAVALLPLFEKDPAAWQALDSLNRGDAGRELTFAEYLRDWHARVPAERKPFVAEVAKLFEIEVP